MDVVKRAPELVSVANQTTPRNVQTDEIHVLKPEAASVMTQVELPLEAPPSKKVEVAEKSVNTVNMNQAS